MVYFESYLNYLQRIQGIIAIFLLYAGLREDTATRSIKMLTGYKFLIILSVVISVIILPSPVAAANVTKIEVHGVIFDEKSVTYNTTLVWDAQRYPGFWYNLGGGKSSETLTINQNASNMTNSSRIIEAGNLMYNTSLTSQNYTVYSAKGLKVNKGLEYNSTTKTFTNSPTGGYYARLGWFGDLYVALNGKANKLTKLVREQAKGDKQTLTIGETWDLGEGFSLTAKSIDAKVSPRQAHLVFSKDGIKLDDKIITEGQVYTYIQSLAGESDVPVFVTYVESIFAGATSDLVQLKYTWLISRNVTEINTGDKFGVFEVTEATENYLHLSNAASTKLDPNAVIDLAGGIKFKVADSSTTLRFYPYVENTIQATTQIETKTTNVSTAVPTVTPDITANTSAVTAAEAATPGPTPINADVAKAEAPPVETPRSTPTPKLPGFETLYAVAGLVAAAYFVLRKRD